MQETNKPTKSNLQNALCYAPFVAIILFFSVEKKSETLKKHIKY